MRHARSVVSCLALALLGCASSGRSAAAPASIAARPAIAAAALRAHMRFLASDALEGRRTGTRGYDLAASYVAAQFEAAGLEAGGEDGTFLRPVPFRVARTRDDGCVLVVERGAGRREPLRLGDDVLVSPDFVRAQAAVDAELVFAGFGVTATTRGHDDYAGLDVRGKIVVVLSGAPPTFPVDERAYHSHRYGKQANAAARGAVGLITVLTPVDERRRSWEKLRLDAVRPGARWVDREGRAADAPPELALVATLHREAAARLVAAAGRELAALFAAAESAGPRGFALGARLVARTETEHTAVSSANVVGRLSGVGPLAHETVVVTAHLDHLGVGAPVDGDAIANGAFDNASGVAILIELARALAAAPSRPRRTFLFVAVTGEEMGLQGSDHLARFPPVPRERLVANVNLDMVLMLGPLTHVVLYGAEHSSLGPTFAAAAAELGLAVAPNPMPEEVVFIRSDQFSFVRQGIPALFPVAHGTGDADSLERSRQWRRTRYHAPSDDLSQPIHWPAGVTFAELCLRGLIAIANAEARPVWNRPNFFGDKFAPR